MLLSVVAGMYILGRVKREVLYTFFYDIFLKENFEIFIFEKVQAEEGWREVGQRI